MKDFVRRKTNKILILSGLDPTGRAGLIKDCTVCKKLNTEFIALATALTLQNDKKFFGMRTVSKRFFSTSLELLRHENIRAIKIGMLANRETARFVIRVVRTLKRKEPRIRVVWDPVFTSTSGGKLIDAKGINYALKVLLPLTDFITPNAIEACTLLNKKFKRTLTAKVLAQLLTEKFKINVYVKGGHLTKKNEDCLICENKIQKLRTPRWPQTHRGTGCALSTAIACFTLKDLSLAAACHKAKKKLEELVSF